MKYILIILLSIVLFSCTQDPSIIASGTEEPEISFDVPAGHFTNPVSSIKLKGNAALHTYYQFSGIKAAGELATVTIITDSLKVMTYHQVYGSGSMFSLNNLTYSYMEAGDYLDITITGYNNGVVNGTFTGKVQKLISLNPLVMQAVNITGIIKNARLRYL